MNNKKYNKSDELAKIKEAKKMAKYISVHLYMVIML